MERSLNEENVNKKNTAEVSALWEAAEHTPYGKYPETVEYTLGKISGANNSNLPVGETYENNAYTRYLKEMLNIQNKDVFELEDSKAYEEAVQMAVEDHEIPDIMVVKGRDTLKKLVDAGMIEDLSKVYEECTTDKIKEMYQSYGENVLQSAVFGGKLYAFPDTVIDHGAMLLWLRKDWMDELGLDEPETMEDAMEIIRQFTEQDMAGNGETIGLACSTDLVVESSYSYGVDPIFTKFYSKPKEWILNSEGKAVYGSVTQETKHALEYLSRLYQEGILDSRFLLRTPENIDRLIIEGKCGAMFGRWWAPNNPLSEAYGKNPDISWKPYILTAQEENKLRRFESYYDWLYVVVRKGYEHPEIVGKYVSVLFDYTRYEDKNAGEINDYFSLNVDPTARPMNINVDYKDALYRVEKNLTDALEKKISGEELSGLEKAYFNTCKSYLNGNLTTSNAWAAYASRIQAIGLLADAGLSEGMIPLSMGEADGEVPEELQRLETNAFLQIVSGEKPVGYFETFVEEWYAKGGLELTRKVRASYEESLR